MLQAKLLLLRKNRIHRSQVKTIKDIGPASGTVTHLGRWSNFYHNSIASELAAVLPQVPGAIPKIVEYCCDIAAETFSIILAPYPQVSHLQIALPPL